METQMDYLHLYQQRNYMHDNIIKTYKLKNCLQNE